MARPRATKSAYKDVEVVWTAALQHQGITFTARSQQSATQTVQRLHHYRILDRQDDMNNQSLYDGFIVQRTSPTTIIIAPRDVEGVMTTPDGQPVDVEDIKQQIATLDNYKADEALRQIGIDTDKYKDPFNPDAPLELAK